MRTLPTINTRSLPHFVGFDRLFDELDRVMTDGDLSSGYPPYNIIKNDEDSYSIEVAVAGFTEDDLDVSVDNGRLVIDGNLNKYVKTTADGSLVKNEDKQPNYLHRGISTRKFRREFVLGEHVHVKSATVRDGMLVVDLEREVPEELKPRKIEIQRK